MYDKIHLRRHQRIHIEKLFRCFACGKSFTRVSALTKHQKIHTWEKLMWLWCMVEVFKTQSLNFTPYFGQRIDTTDNAYKYQECGNILGFMRKHILYRSQISMCLLVRSLGHEFFWERFLTSFTNVKKKKKKNLILRAQVSPVGSDYLSWRNTQQCHVCGYGILRHAW